MDYPFNGESNILSNLLNVTLLLLHVFIHTGKKMGQTPSAKRDGLILLMQIHK